MSSREGVARRFGAVRRCLLALALAGAAGAARADIIWDLNATFDDGSILTGRFSINPYGQFGFWDLRSDVEEYSTGSSPTWGDATELDFFPGPYSNALELLFQNDLGVATSTPNAIVGGIGGPSYECRDSFNCYTGDPNTGGAYRWITAGAAIAEPAPPQVDDPTSPYYCPPGHDAPAPEPAAWALMTVGFGLAGAALRRRRPVAA